MNGESTSRGSYRTRGVAGLPPRQSQSPTLRRRRSVAAASTSAIPFGGGTYGVPSIGRQPGRGAWSEDCAGPADWSAAPFATTSMAAVRSASRSNVGSARWTRRVCRVRPGSERRVGPGCRGTGAGIVVVMPGESPAYLIADRLNQSIARWVSSDLTSGHAYPGAMVQKPRQQPGVQHKKPANSTGFRRRQGVVRKCSHGGIRRRVVCGNRGQKVSESLPHCCECSTAFFCRTRGDNSGIEWHQRRRGEGKGWLPTPMGRLASLRRRPRSAGLTPAGRGEGFGRSASRHNGLSMGVHLAHPFDPLPCPAPRRPHCTGPAPPRRPMGIVRRTCDSRMPSFISERKATMQ